MNIQLTIEKEQGTVPASPYTAVFPSEKIKALPHGNKAIIHYFPDNSEREEYVVSESLSTIQMLTGESSKKQLKATLDASAGIAIGTVNLVNATDGNDAQLPDNAIVVNSYYVVETTFTSSTDAATIALGIDTNDAGGIKAAVAISDAGNPWDLGNHDGIQDGAAANFSVQTTAQRNLIADIAVEALTAGKLTLFVEYVVV